MSTTPATRQMVTEHAIRVAQTLSPAMKDAMLRVDRNFLPDRRVKVGTTVALMRRELMGHVVRTAPAGDGQYVQVDNDYDEGNAGYGHLLTELGEAVLQVLVRGPEVALKRAIAADEQASLPIEAENAELPVEPQVQYDVALHKRLVLVSHHEYRVFDGNLYRVDATTTTGQKLVLLSTVAEMTELSKAGLIEEKRSLVARSLVAQRMVWLRLTDKGTALLLAWDKEHGRSRPMPYVAELPPRATLLAPPTKDTVRRYPAYYISGPGRLLAEQVLCEHDYRLTDSCPCC